MGKAPSKGSEKFMIIVLGNPAPVELRNIKKVRVSKKPGIASVKSVRIPAEKRISLSPLKYLGGAYDDQSNIIASSCLTRYVNGKEVCATIPYNEIPKVTQSFENALFGGVYFHHFGHFMLESMARVWAAVEAGYSGPVIFQSSAPQQSKFSKEILKKLCINPVFLLGTECVHVDKLLIPDAALIEGASANSSFLIPFQKIASTIGGRSNYGRKLFVSRGGGVAKVFGEDIIQAALVDAGYDVLDPTCTTIDEQVRAFRDAEVIVGVIGSAMHNMVYAQNAKKVAYIARTASVNNNFPTIDQISHPMESFYIYSSKNILPPHPKLLGPFMLDTIATLEALCEAKFLEKFNIDYSSVLQMQDSYMREWIRIKNELLQGVVAQL